MDKTCQTSPKKTNYSTGQKIDKTYQTSPPKKNHSNGLPEGHYRQQLESVNKDNTLG